MNQPRAQLEGSGIPRIIETPTFRVHIIRGYISNIFLVEYPGSLMVFDPGVSGDVPVIEKYFSEALRRPVTDLDLSVVSHMHPDHSGCAVALRKKYGIPITANPRSDLWYGGLTGYLQYGLDSIMTIWVGLHVRGSVRKVRFKRVIGPDRPPDEEGRVPGFEDWRAVNIPGHTMHDIALFHAGEGILYAADAVICVRGKYVPPIPISFKDHMKESYRTLGALPASVILLAHGDIVTDADTAQFFEKAVARLDRKKPWMARAARYFSVYSPEIWKYKLKNLQGK